MIGRWGTTCLRKASCCLSVIYEYPSKTGSNCRLCPPSLVSCGHRCPICPTTRRPGPATVFWPSPWNGYTDDVAGFSRRSAARPNSSGTTCFTPARRNSTSIGKIVFCTRWHKNRLITRIFKESQLICMILASTEINKYIIKSNEIKLIAR